jgi:hypothetical protein
MKTVKLLCLVVIPVGCVIAMSAMIALLFAHAVVAKDPLPDMAIASKGVVIGGGALAPVGSAGTCANCDLTIDAFGRVVAKATGTGIPVQTGHAGETLGSNGTTAAWSNPDWNLVTLTKGCMDAKAAGAGSANSDMQCDTVSTGTTGGGGGKTRGAWLSPGQNGHFPALATYWPFTTSRTVKLTVWDVKTGGSLATCNVSTTGQGVYTCNVSSVQVYGGKGYYVTNYDTSNTDNAYVWASSGGSMSFTGATLNPPMSVGPFIMNHPSAVCSTANSDCVPNSLESSRFATVWPVFITP